MTEMFRRTADFEQFVQPARERGELWRFAVGFVLITSLYIAVLVGGFALFSVLAPPAVSEAYFDAAFAGMTRLTLAIELGSFAALALAVVLVVRLLHRRGPVSLFGPLRRGAKDFGIALAVFAAVSVAAAIVVLAVVDTAPQHPLWTVLAFLPVAIPLVLLQTGAEELFFRGYILQQLAARFRSPWIWMVAPSVFFGVLHFDPDIPVSNAVVIAASITLTGLLWADLVRVTGSLGAAWGWHFANNFLVMNAIGFNDTLSGFAFRVLPFGYEDAPTWFFVMDPVMALVTWAVLRRVL